MISDCTDSCVKQTTCHSMSCVYLSFSLLTTTQVDTLPLFVSQQETEEVRFKHYLAMFRHHYNKLSFAGLQQPKS